MTEKQRTFSLRVILHQSPLPKGEGAKETTSRTLGLDRFLTWPPFRLAKPAGLQGLDDAQGFFGRTSNVQIMNDFVAQHAFRIDHEQTAQCDAFVFDEHAIIA